LSQAAKIRSRHSKEWRASDGIGEHRNALMQKRGAKQTKTKVIGQKVWLAPQNLTSPVTPANVQSPINMNQN
jgi:hypothetical protein